tara:strand:+ start:803 stop:964 length:162 start_codon:yes stop_codon:yes gene_type:complete
MRWRRDLSRRRRRMDTSAERRVRPRRQRCRRGVVAHHVEQLEHSLDLFLHFGD